jgi:membrane protein YdbS with pleckstrin-like domain
MQFDWEAPRVKGTFIFSSLIPGLMSLAAYEWGFPWEWVALLAVPSGIMGGFLFGAGWKNSLLYSIPSIVTALATVGVVWLVIRWQPSVPFMELVLCQMVAAVGTMPLWRYFYQRLEAEEDPQAARLAAWKAATRRDD